MGRDIAKGIGKKTIKEEVDKTAKAIAQEGMYSEILDTQIVALAGLKDSLISVLKIEGVDKEKVDALTKLTTSIDKTTAGLVKNAKMAEEYGFTSLYNNTGPGVESGVVEDFDFGEYG